MIETLEYLLLKALDKEKENCKDIVRPRRFELWCGKDNFEKLLRFKTLGAYTGLIHEFCLTFNGVQIKVTTNKEDPYNQYLKMVNQIDEGLYVELAKLDTKKYFVNLKRFRLYMKIWGTPTLYNFNHNNDIIPWIQYQYRRLKEKLFGIEFMNDGANISQYPSTFWEFTYNMYRDYKTAKYNIIQEIRCNSDGNVMVIERVNSDIYSEDTKKYIIEKWDKLVKSHEEAGTLLQFGEHNIDKIKQLCFGKYV